MQAACYQPYEMVALGGLRYMEQFDRRRARRLAENDSVVEIDGEEDGGEGEDGGGEEDGGDEDPVAEAAVARAELDDARTTHGYGVVYTDKGVPRVHMLVKRGTKMPVRGATSAIRLEADAMVERKANRFRMAVQIVEGEFEDRQAMAALAPGTHVLYTAHATAKRKADGEPFELDLDLEAEPERRMQLRMRIGADNSSEHAERLGARR